MVGHVLVGMIDPADEAFIGSFQEGLKKQIPPQLYDEKKVFHLRGAIDYSQLELKYRMASSRYSISSSTL